MKRFARFALIVAPFVAVGAGVAMARLSSGDAAVACNADVVIQMLNGQTEFVRGQSGETICSAMGSGSSCMVFGPQTVQVLTDDSETCYALAGEQHLQVAWRDGEPVAGVLLTPQFTEQVESSFEIVGDDRPETSTSRETEQ